MAHLEQTPDVLGVCEVSPRGLPFPGDAAHSWGQVCAGEAHRVSGFAAGAASNTGQNEAFQKCLGKARAQIHCKSKCVQVSG